MFSLIALNKHKCKKMQRRKKREEMNICSFNNKTLRRKWKSQKGCCLDKFLLLKVVLQVGYL